MPTAKEIMPIAEFLQVYGGWAVSAVCLIIIWRMASSIESLYKEQIAALREDQRELVAAMISTRGAIKALKELFLSRLGD